VQRPEDVVLPDDWDERQREERRALIVGLLVAFVLTVLLSAAAGAPSGGTSLVLAIVCPGVALLRVTARRKGWIG
jgi:hypothetical protein